MFQWLSLGHLIEVDANTHFEATVKGFRYYEEDSGPIIVQVDNTLRRVYASVFGN